MIEHWNVEVTVVLWLSVLLHSLLRSHIALAIGNQNKKQWRCTASGHALLLREGQVLFFVYLTCPFVDLFPNSLLLHWSVIPPLSCCLSDLQSKTGIANRWETTTTFRHGLHIHSGLQDLRWTSVRIAGATFGVQTNLCIFLQIASFGTHCAFFRGTTCAHTFMTPTLPRTIMSRWCGTNMALNAVFHVAL
jgi:hypothetical protein